MADPVIQSQDLLQQAPQDILSGDKYTFPLQYFIDDGTGNILRPATVNFNSAVCSVRNLEAPNTEIDDPTVTKTTIANGVQLSFQIDSSVLATYPIGRYVAKLSYVFENETPDDLLSDLIFFNIVGVTNPFT